MRRPILAACLALLALPSAALAGPVKLSPTASAVSAAGVTAIEAANTSRSVLRGRATVSVGRRTVASRAVRLPARSVSTVSMRLSSAAQSAVRAAGGRATIALKVGRAGGRRTVARRTLTLRLPAAAPQAGAPATPGAAAPAPGSAPAGPARWVGRMGTEGGYDDFELTVDGGQMQITKPPAVPVSCMENGGGYRISLSMELFDAPGPWTLGTDGLVAKQGIAVNQLVNGGSKTINFKVTETTQDAGRIAGKLGISFSDSKYDVFTAAMTFVNCAGAHSFEAVPA